MRKRGRERGREGGREQGKEGGSEGRKERREERTLLQLHVAPQLVRTFTCSFEEEGTQCYQLRSQPMHIAQQNGTCTLYVHCTCTCTWCVYHKVR